MHRRTKKIEHDGHLKGQRTCDIIMMHRQNEITDRKPAGSNEEFPSKKVPLKNNDTQAEKDSR